MADQRSNVGTYAITQGSLAGGNYVLTYQGANLTVGQRALTVAADAKSRTYGDANPALTFTSTGLVNGDTTSGALATTADQRSNVGSYAITRGSLQASGNYNVTYQGANLTVTPRPLTITADLVRRFAGEANPALTFQVGGRGLANGDTLTGSLFTAATSSSPAGSYPIRQGSLLASSNYTLTFLPGRLVVAPTRVVTPEFTAGVQQRDSLVQVFTPGGDTATLDLLNYVDAVVLSEGGAAQRPDCVENKPCRTIR